MARFLAALAAAIGGFIRWWLAELAGLVPPTLSRVIRRGDRILWLDLAGDRVSVHYVAGKSCRRLGESETGGAGGDGSPNPIASMLAGVPLGKTRVALRLPAQSALRKTLVMPQAAEPDMRRALALQIDRQSPFGPEEVYFDYRVAARRAEARELDVELVVVPKTVVDAALDAVAGWGLSPSIVDIAEDPEPGAEPRLNLISAAEHLNGARRWSRPNLALACLAAALLAAAIYVPLERERAGAQALSRQAATAKAEAEATFKLRETLDRLRSGGRFLAERKARTPSVLGALNELTRLFPDDNWLYELQFNGTDIRVSGYANSASALIAAIDGSPLFAKPSFRSPVTQDQASGLEKFSLSFEFEGAGEIEGAGK